jgi:hypothetical protein
MLIVRQQRKDLINSLTVEYDERFIRKHGYLLSSPEKPGGGKNVLSAECSG